MHGPYSHGRHFPLTSRTLVGSSNALFQDASAIDMEYLTNCYHVTAS